MYVYLEDNNLGILLNLHNMLHIIIYNNIFFHVAAENIH